MTWLELTNTVLKRLRENPVTTVSQTTYSALIGQFVNEAKREVEDAWDWNSLRTIITINTVGGTSNYTLVGAGKRFRVIDNPINTTQKSMLSQISRSLMNEYLYLATQQQGMPAYYNFNGNTAGDPNIDLNPTPIGVETIQFNLVIPQADFTLDSTGLLVPEWPVIMGAWAKAVSERGEDGGASSSEIDGMYRGAVADAVCQDAGLARDELIWQAV
jgi:hypothetical protein